MVAPGGGGGGAPRGARPAGADGGVWARTARTGRTTAQAAQNAAAQSGPRASRQRRAWGVERTVAASVHARAGAITKGNVPRTETTDRGSAGGHLSRSSAGLVLRRIERRTHRLSALLKRRGRRRRHRLLGLGSERHGVRV